MTIEQSRPATVADLSRAKGQAELVGGRIVNLSPAGRQPAKVQGRIVRSLDDYAALSGRGEAYSATIVFLVAKLPSGRESFSPDASYFDGPFPADEMRFIDGPPDFAAEVRNENDYGPAAEEEMADKRGDYFTAGTEVVWDVDPVAECVYVYHADAPDEPRVFRRGEIADAEPAVPGWRMAVDAIFE